MTQPLGAQSAGTPWWLQSGTATATRPKPSSSASSSAPAAGSSALGASAVRPQTGSTPGEFPLAASASDRQWLNKLVTSSGTATDLLAQLTGIDFAAGSSPDYVAARSGTGVTSQYSGGTNTVNVVDGSGYTINYFSTGNPPNAMKGAAVTFAPDVSAKVRAAGIAEAQDYLTQHLDDHHSVDGHWNRPIFNVRTSLDVRA